MQTTAPRSLSRGLVSEAMLAYYVRRTSTHTSDCAISNLFLFVGVVSPLADDCFASLAIIITVHQERQNTTGTAGQEHIKQANSRWDPILLPAAPNALL
jgi:hypothetical protein